MKTAMEQLTYELELDGYQFDNNVLEKYVEKEKTANNRRLCCWRNTTIQWR